MFLSLRHLLFNLVWHVDQAKSVEQPIDIRHAPDISQCLGSVHYLSDFTDFVVRQHHGTPRKALAVLSAVDPQLLGELLSPALLQRICKGQVGHIRMPELLDELTIARSSGELKKLLAFYKKVDLLILDEWLIRPLTPQESYDLLEIAEARSQRSMIFCTQYQPVGWYTRIDPNPESDSPISEAIMDRIVHNSYKILIEGRISMR